MPPPKTQSPMNPNDAAASLAMATQISTQLGQQANPQAPNQAQGAPQQPQTENTPDSRINALEEQFKQLQVQVGQAIKEEIGEVKKMIQQAMTEEDSHESAKT